MIILKATHGWPQTWPRLFCLQGKPMDFSGVDESTSRWVEDFSGKTYATPAKLESIDGGAANVGDFYACVWCLPTQRSGDDLSQGPGTRSCSYRTAPGPWLTWHTAAPCIAFSHTSSLTKVSAAWAPGRLGVRFTHLTQTCLCRYRTHLCCRPGSFSPVLHHGGTEVDLQQLQPNRGQSPRGHHLGNTLISLCLLTSADVCLVLEAFGVWTGAPARLCQPAFGGGGLCERQRWIIHRWAGSHLLTSAPLTLHKLFIFLGFSSSQPVKKTPCTWSSTDTWSPVRTCSPPSSLSTISSCSALPSEGRRWGSSYVTAQLVHIYIYGIKQTLNSGKYWIEYLATVGSTWIEELFLKTW